MKQTSLINNVIHEMTYTTKQQKRQEGYSTEDSDFVQYVTDEVCLISGAAYLYWSSSTNF